MNKNFFLEETPKEEIRNLLIKLISSTNFVNKSYYPSEKDFPSGIHLKYNIKNFYISIAPEITLYLDNYPSDYNGVVIDLRNYNLGDDKCEHKFINLHWEEGGGMMDSGTPYNYKMCCKCGFHPKEPSIWSRVKSFIGKAKTP